MRTVQGPNGSAGGAGSALGGLLTAGSAIALQAGMGLAQNDLATIDADGLVYKVTDAATVLTPNQGTVITATTQISANNAPPELIPEPLFLADGTYVVYANDNAGNQHVFQRYTRAGALIKQILVAYSAPLSFFRWGVLSNGNIGCAMVAQSVFRTLILGADLSVVQATTTVETCANSAVAFKALSGGGFAVSWTGNANPAPARFAIFSNAGAAVLAPTSLYTLGSGTHGLDSTIDQFANGNIIVTGRHVVAGNAVRMGVFTSAGAVVLAYAVWAGSADEINPKITIRGDFACLHWSASSTTRAVVVNSSGVNQGTAFSLASAVAEVNCGTDGTDFLLLSFNSSNYTIRVTRLPITGAANATTADLARTLNSGGFYTFRATFADNEFVLAYSTANGQPIKMARIRLDATFAAGGDIFGASTSTALTAPVMLCPGVMVLCHSNVSNFWSFTVARYRNAAIAGVVTAATAKGATAILVAANGSYQTTAIFCDTPTNFNHNATNIIGQRGTLYPRGVAFRGLVA